MLIYLAFSSQLELDECLITFLYSISKFDEYHKNLKTNSKVFFGLMQKHIEPDPEKNEVALESCRQKLFSMFHNLTENDEVCKELPISDFVKYTNKMF